MKEPRRVYSSEFKRCALELAATSNCCGNGLMESFWATLKVELIDGIICPSHTAAKQAIFQYIEGFYNQRHQHFALGCLTPAEFERRHPTGA